MRLASVRTASGRAIGRVTEDHQYLQVLDPSVGTVDEVVRGDLDRNELDAAFLGVPYVARASVALESPVQQFNRDILCTGWNYLDHFYESAGKREGQDPAAMPDRPTFFTKGPGTVIGPHDPIAYDADLSEQWDYEAEVAVVIGTDGTSIPEAGALGHVFGYLLANDVSQRDLQRAYGGQWLKGKSVDSTMPLGPWITTADDVPDPDVLSIECDLNGNPMQSASVSDMAFPIARIISELSRGMALRAGDVVLTGTPSGIGNAREPRVFLRPGDTLVTRSNVLGEMSSRVAGG